MLRVRDSAGRRRATTRWGPVLLIRQTLLYLPAQIVAPLVAFASVLIWAHLLTPADLGVVTLLVAIQEICYAAFFGWWGLYTLRFIAGFTTPDDRRTYLRTETVAMALSTVIEILAVIPILYFSLKARMTPAFGLLAVLFVLTRSFNLYCADRARAETRVLLYTLVQTVGPVFGFCVGLAGIWIFGPSPYPVVAGFLAAQGLGVALSIGMSDFCRGLGRPSLSMVKQAIAFGGTQTTSQLLAILAMNAPRFIVSHVLGLAALGRFSVGYSLGIRASSFAVSLVTAGSYPLVVRKMQTEGQEAAFKQLSQNMAMVALVVAPVAFGLLGVSRSIVDLLVAPQYREVTYLVLPLATLGGLFRYLRAHTSDQVFLLSLRPGFGTIVAACDIVIAVASAYIGVRLMGASGGAFGPMVSGLATFTVSFLLSRFVFGYRAPLWIFARILVAAAMMGGVIYVLPEARNIPVLVAYVALGGLLYSAAVFFAMPTQARALRQTLASRFKRKPPKVTP